MKAVVAAFLYGNNDLSRTMLNTSGLLYLNARAISAVETFFRCREIGHYVLIFAWSLRLWLWRRRMRFSYFASGGKRVSLNWNPAETFDEPP